MSPPVSTLKKEDLSELPPPDQAFEWPRQAEKTQNWEEAARRWAILRKAYPDDPSTWIQGAHSNISAGKPDTADKLLEFARQHFPNHPDVLLASADQSMRNQDWKAADVYLTEARETFPDNIQTWLKSSEYAERRENMELAEEYNGKARLEFPERYEPLIQHAELAMRAENWEQALDRWETLRTHFPNIPDGYVKAATTAKRLNRFQEARRLLLAHQYGPDILEGATNINSGKLRSRKSSVLQLLDLIWTKAVFNLRSEVHHNFLLYGWWVIEPLLHMAAYYVVFGLLLNRGGENYPVFLLSGLVPWMWFAKAVTGSSNSIITGRHLLSQVGLPSITFPLVSILEFTLKQMPAFVLLLFFVSLLGYPPNAHWWALVPLMVVQAIITIAISCIVAAIIPFIRDLNYIVPTGLTLLMFLSGIFYDYRMIAPEWQEFFLLNPMAFLLTSYREILMENTLPDFTSLSLWGLGGIFVCILVLFAYQRLRYIYPRVVLQ